MTRLTKRRIVHVLLAVGLLAAACGDNASDTPEAVTLSFGYPFSAMHPLRVQVLEPWAEDVHAATGGTVTIEFHPERTLSSGAETYANVATGGQDMGWALQGYVPGRFPATGVVEMPFVFDSSSQATEVLWALYDEFEALRDEYADVKLLGLWTTGPGDLWLAQGSASSVADLAGLTLRSPGPVQDAVIRALGANPVSIAAQDFRDALEGGDIDGLLTVNTALAAHGSIELLESGTACGCYVLAMFLAMNLDAWNGLSPGQQAAIEELSGQQLSDAVAIYYDTASAAADARNAAAGIVKIRLDDDQLAEWQEATRSVVDNWIAGNGGDFDARAMYERMLELATE